MRRPVIVQWLFVVVVVVVVVFILFMFAVICVSKYDLKNEKKRKQ
jgi:heme/copper-type cytochrome/quinol oxidase subunit 2